MATEKKIQQDKKKPSSASGAKGDTKKRGGAKTAELKERITALEQELADAKDAALRTRAEMDNYRKRVQRELADARLGAKCDALSAVLDVYDHFKMAMDAARTSEDLNILREGMEMIAREFDKAFSDAGVEIINAEGTTFDPDIHEAVGTEPSDKEEGVVLKQWRCGYRLGDRLLRPASVVVSGGPEQNEEKGDEGDV